MSHLTTTRLLLGAGLLLLGACAMQEAAAPAAGDRSNDAAMQTPPVEPVAKHVLADQTDPSSTAARQPVEASAREQLRKTEAPVHSEPVAATPPIMGVKGRDVVRAPSIAPMPVWQQAQNTERYAHFETNPVRLAAETPVSTFSIDVDTGAYANVRRFLNQGRLPPHDAVRVEEMINYFSYDDPAPGRLEPFAVRTEMAPAPWRANRTLLRIGIKGQDLSRERMPAVNLVFLIDISGSMQSPDKIGLVKSGLGMLVDRLRPQDRVSIVVYAAGTGVALEPTSGSRKDVIRAAIERLQPGGSTHGEAGIRLAYAMAKQGWIENGINRILLATDGDFNVGITDFQSLKNLVEEKRKTGVSLTTLGFGVGNYNDHLMEQLADAGNGNYAYIDNLNEAQKVLVDEVSSTLATIAKDVKIQIEFNPAVVREYRLIGYENRVLQREDFNNDQVDAGEIGAGHSVTALYELTLVDQLGQIDPLRYGKHSPVKPGKGEELAFLRLRYKAPDGGASILKEWPLLRRDLRADLAAVSSDFRFSAAVAAFGQILRGGVHTDGYRLDDVARLAQGAVGRDAYGYRAELLRLIRLADSLGAGAPAKPDQPHQE